jgi:hypothetical protein
LLKIFFFLQYLFFILFFREHKNNKRDLKSCGAQSQQKLLLAYIWLSFNKCISPEVHNIKNITPNSSYFILMCFLQKQESKHLSNIRNMCHSTKKNNKWVCFVVSSVRTRIFLGSQIVDILWNPKHVYLSNNLVNIQMCVIMATNNFKKELDVVYVFNIENSTFHETSSKFERTFNMLFWFFFRK